jgi:hypothetical protein
LEQPDPGPVLDRQGEAGACLRNSHTVGAALFVARVDPHLLRAVSTARGAGQCKLIKGEPTTSPVSMLVRPAGQSPMWGMGLLRGAVLTAVGKAAPPCRNSKARAGRWRAPMVAGEDR